MSEKYKGHDPWCEIPSEMEKPVMLRRFGVRCTCSDFDASILNKLAKRLIKEGKVISVEGDEDE